MLIVLSAMDKVGSGGRMHKLFESLGTFAAWVVWASYPLWPILVGVGLISLGVLIGLEIRG